MQGIAPAQRSKRSAGIVLYRRRLGAIEILLVHPGGPYWAHRDDAAWSIPKGEYGSEEDALVAARREFMEETGSAVDGPFVALSPVRQPSGKVVSAWAVEGDLDPLQLHSNTFLLEWPPNSGVMQAFPEVDRGAWYSLIDAHAKLSPGQRPFLLQLVALTGGATP